MGEFLKTIHIVFIVCSCNLLVGIFNFVGGGFIAFVDTESNPFPAITIVNLECQGC